MLSKSQAKAFFIIGTAAFSAIFVGLTIDTFNRIPKQTNAGELTDSSIRGKHLFEKNNCMGCHTIMGEGAYYAPELTKVIDRRGESFVKLVLKDPEAMFPGQRKMINYKFTEQEINDLTAFLTWVGKMDLNGFPAKPDIMSAATLPPMTAGLAQPQIFNQMCTACHALNGQGGNVGPSLDGVGSKFDINYLTQRITDPASVKADTKMPKLPLTENQITELANYLSSLKGN